MLVGDFEQHFRTVVLDSGGELIPETESETADFLFAKENVVAELKTLQEDARREHAMKLQGLVNDWMKRGLMLIYGRVQISLQNLNPTCQREWLEALQAPVQRIIHKANRQIRATKQSRGLADAKGLLIIANDGNLLHTNPIDYMILVSRVLQKKKQTGERQFPNIAGVIYFSYRIPSRNEGVPFWIAGDTETAGDPIMSSLQEKLKSGWFSYIERMTGMPVMELLRPVT